MIKSNTKERPTEPPKETKSEMAAPRRSDQEKAVLRFSPTAWAKLLFFRDYGETEIGGFGVCGAEDLLYVDQFVTVRQEASVASVSFDDAAVADYFDAQVDEGRKPEQFARIWLHTHPGDSPQPSGTDLGTFARVFGGCQWAVMFILARNGKSYARMRFNVGPGGQVLVPVEVDYSRPFGPSDRESWEIEYHANIHADTRWQRSSLLDEGWGDDLAGYAIPEDWLEDLEDMDPADRRAVLDELAVRPDLWEGSEVFNVH